MTIHTILFGLTALVFAALLSFTAAPIARFLAHRLGAIDVPKDDRRMHKEPIPLLGGLAIFFAFAVTSLLFAVPSNTLFALLFGGMIIVTCGVLDDMFNLNPLAKLVFQVLAAVAAIALGVRIESVNLFGQYVVFGPFSYLVTFIWIIALINSINLIDGLDGLACGVSAISSLSLLVIAVIMSESQIALFTAILVGACIGFLPFNSFPAKMFIGDTGAMFLGFTLSVLSVEGVFKAHTLFAFFAPLALFALPLFDTVFAFFRRICRGQNPFRGDRGHIHHRLIGLGFSHRQTVLVLYAICGMCGASAVVLLFLGVGKAFLTLAIGLLILAINYLLLKKNILPPPSDKPASPSDSGDKDGRS